MKTVFTTDPLEAAKFIKRGGIVAFPTETVYGLGANVFDERALASIFRAKQRPADNPLIVHIADQSQIRELAAEITGSADALIKAFFPGPLTVVVRKAVKVSLLATAGLDTIGIRMPRAQLAHSFLTACAVPVAAPSANLSGRPSPTSWNAVAEDLDGRIDCILQGEATEIGLESTVVDCTTEIPMLLRTGAVSLQQLRSVVPDAMVYSGAGEGVARSPGMKHRHYSPEAKVVVVGTLPQHLKEGAAYIGLDAPEAEFVLKRICKSIDEYAKEVFEFFRECDRRQVKTVYCQQVEESGIGIALMDRLRRAAAG